MKKWLLTIVFGAALVLGACGGSDDADGGKDEGGADSGDTENTEVSAGEEAYQTNNCMSCHGGNLEGVSGPSLETVGSDHSVADIEDIIENGQGGMPAQPQVSEDDRTAIAEWLADKK